MSPKLSLAIMSLAPGARFVLRGSDLAQLEWLDTDQARPSDEAIHAELARLKALAEAPPELAIHIAWIEQALLEIGKLDAVDAAVAQNRATQALWRRVTTMRRTDPEVAAIGAALSIDLDALFARADEIRRARGE